MFTRQVGDVDYEIAHSAAGGGGGGGGGVGAHIYHLNLLQIWNEVRSVSSVTSVIQESELGLAY